MSWLGVNLNDSLSSLKGQLSNFTSNVLSEDFVEGEDDDSQVVVPRDQIKELEALCQLQKHELEECKRARAEVEERLHAADIHAAHQTKLLRQQLQESEAELKKLRDKTVEWGWDAGDVANNTSNHDGSQNHEWADGFQGLNHHNHQTSVAAAADDKLQLQNQQLSRRVEDLDRELGSLRDTHQEQIALLQDQHRQQLLALRGQQKQDGGRSSPANASMEETEDGLPERSTRGEDASAWEQERMQLEAAKETLSSRVDVLQRQVNQLKAKDEEVVHQQEKLSSLTEECSRLRGENEQHLKNLEELDVQHQAVVEQIITKKKNLQEEVQQSKAAYDQLTEQVVQYQSQKLESEAEIQRLKTELQISEMSDNSNGNLESQVTVLSNEMSSLKEQLHQESLEKSKLLEEKDKLEEEISKVKEEEAVLLALKAQHSLELDKVEKQCLELQNSNSHLRSSLEKITEEVNKLRVSEASAQELLKASDEKKLASEAEVVSLNSKLSSLTVEMSRLAVSEEYKKKSHQDGIIEGQKQQEVLQEKLSAAEIEKKKLELDLKRANQSVQDATSRTGILESELQAKAQELEISNERISELQTKSKLIESEMTKHRMHKKEDHEQLKKMLSSHNIEVSGNFGTDIHKVAELVRDSTWQRDTLERHVSSIAQELREKKEQLQEAETTRIDLERECEDLRDQLEEIQKGVRPQPEGSSRALPTIEEESEGCGEGDGEAASTTATEGVGTRAGGREQTKISNETLLQERASQVEALQAQVEALSEARRNLETEVSNMRSERETLQGQLRESEGRTGNLLNLETEAASLRAEKSALEMRLNSLTHQVDLESVTLKDERDGLEEQVNGLEQHISRLQAEMTLNRLERESIGQQLLTQYEIQESREATIRVLEGELEGLKEKLREKFLANDSESDTLAQRKARETKLLDDLNGLRSQLIFKEDKIDELSQVLKEVGKHFGLENINPESVLLNIQNAYRALQSQIQEQKQKLQDVEKALQTEKDHCSKNDDLLKSECSLREDKEQEANLFKEKLEKSEMEVFQLREKVEELSTESGGRESDFLTLQQQIRDLEREKNEALSTLTQNLTELTNLNQEKNQLLEMVAKERESSLHLQQERETLLADCEKQVTELGEKNREALEQLSMQKEDTKRVVEERENRISTLQNQLLQFQKDNSAIESFISENEKLMSREKTLREENDRLCQERKNLQEDNERLATENKEAVSGREIAVQQYSSLQAERDQMIATITQKHQESLTYHAEIQRLMQVLNQTAQTSAEENASLMSQLAESRSSLSECQAQVTSLRGELEGVKKVRDDLQKSAADDIIKKTEVSGLRKEIENLQSKYNNLEQERDQLRVANAHFNTQYQDQSKELLSIREKEGRLSTECERLRQHLVTVEESYTAEAIKAEERESTLRSTLGKMEEKLNNHSTFYSSASQRASVQVESLQEQLRELSAKRDDAVHRLHAAEEAAEQHQQSLATLQQVLQDFQKSQAREISEATERTRRQLEEEQEKSMSFSAQVESLKTQLTEVQSALGAASRLGEQLDKKDQMIVALKAQVTSQEEVARRARDEVICLKTSSEGKIEKNLLRNLLVGYFATPLDKRQEVLRIIAEVLDFSGEERSRTGLDIQGRSWLSSIANFLAPPASNVQVTSKVDVLDHTSLSQAFIRFLEDESTPRPQARLPAVQMARKTEEKAEKKAQAKAQAANKINPFVSSGEAAPTETNTESRNSPLLAAASAPPTLPTFTPLVPASSMQVEGNPAASGTVVTASGITTPVSTNKYLTNLLGPEGAAKEDNK